MAFASNQTTARSRLRAIRSGIGATVDGISGRRARIAIGNNATPTDSNACASNGLRVTRAAKASKRGVCSLGLDSGLSVNNANRGNRSNDGNRVSVGKTSKASNMSLSNRSNVSVGNSSNGDDIAVSNGSNISNISNTRNRVNLGNGSNIASV